MTTVAEAYDQMMDHATQACAGLTVVYGDDPPAAALTGKTAWARATVKYSYGGQRGFGDNKSKYIRYGIMCIEIFAPKGDGDTLLNTMMEQVLISIENRKSYPVWYRNIRAAGPVPDGGYNKINIYADFQFDSNH